MHLSYDPIIPVLGIYPRETRSYVHTKTCIPMFLVALFIIAKNSKQFKNSLSGSVGKQIVEQWNATEYEQRWVTDTHSISD